MFDALARTFSGVFDWFQGKGKVTESQIAEAFEKVRDSLLDADVPLGLVDEFLSQIRSDIAAQNVAKMSRPADRCMKIVYERLQRFLGGTEANGTPTLQIPSVIMMIGLQGSGKTTTVAKLAHWINGEAAKRKKKRRILCGSVDFNRPAAIDQLEILAARVGIDMFRASSTDAVQASRELVQRFKSEGYEYLILDTAGRLHVDQTLLDELRAIDAIAQPKYKILVLDAMTGQESLRVARSFNDAVGFNAAILTKTDSDTRGGAAFAFRYSLGRPIWFVGAGEKVGDLEPFLAERMASRILGMGDVMTLVEKADEHIERSRQEDVSRRLMNGTFTLEDFALQLEMVQQMGSLQKIMQYMPFAPKVSPDALERGEREMGRFRAIVSSMTKKERVSPHILDASRKRRVAQGAGVPLEDVEKLLSRFEESKQFAKLLKKGGGLRGIFR